MTDTLAVFREHDVVDLPNAFRGTVLSTEGTTARIATIGSPTTTLWRFADLRLYHRPAPFVEVQVPPTATQEIESAIERLNEFNLQYGVVNGWLYEIDESITSEDPRVPLTTDPYAVTLHRTIDAQLVILVGSLAADLDGRALALARAINGDS